MKWKFKKRKGQFGTFNNRNENHGPDDKVKAIDLPVRHPITPRELDMLVPVEEGGVPLSQFLFGSDLRKPHLQTFVLFPIKVYRKPEHVKLTIFDKGSKGIAFDEVKVKDPVVSIDLDDKMEIAYKLQFHPGHHLQRISDSIEEKVCEFQCEATQEELFGRSDEDEGGEEGAPPAQAELPGTQPAGRPRVPDDTTDLGPIPGQDEEFEEDDDEDEDDED